MSKRNRREHGRILSVETMQRGSALDVDAAAGATSITVTDAGDFDEDGGWLFIGAQVVEFTACDDDTGSITLADPLTAAAEQGDPVAVYDPLYEEVVDYQLVLVELDGEYDNPDPVVAEVAEGVGDLPEGDRGKAGESCILLRVGEDEWEVVGVGSRPRSASGVGSVRWEADDFYVLTAADITAGVATFPLSHVPLEESVDARWRTTPQEPTEYTVNAAAQTITWPLSGFEAAGDRLWAHYQYRVGITTQPATAEVIPFAWRGFNTGGGGSTSVTAVGLPVGTQIGDSVLVLGHIGKQSGGGSFTVTDPRFSKLLDLDAPDAGDGTPWSDASVWIGTATDLTDVAMLADPGAGTTDVASVIVASFAGAIDPARVATISSTAGSVTLPAVPGTGTGALAVSVARYGVGASTWSVGAPYAKATDYATYCATAIGYVETVGAVGAATSSWSGGPRSNFAVIGVA